MLDLSRNQDYCCQFSCISSLMDLQPQHEANKQSTCKPECCTAKVMRLRLYTGCSLHEAKVTSTPSREAEDAGFVQKSRLLLLVFLHFKFDGQFEAWNKKQIELLIALLGFEAGDPLVRGLSDFCPKNKGSICLLSQKRGVHFDFVQ